MPQSSSWLVPRLCVTLVLTAAWSAAGSVIHSPACSSGSAAHMYGQWVRSAAEVASHSPERASVKVHSNQRIGRFAGEVFTSVGSTSQGIKAAKEQRLLLNGETVEHHRRVAWGDVVTLLPPKEPDHIDYLDSVERAIRFAEGLISTGTLSVLYEDDDMAIVAKPAGVHTKPFGAALAFEHALPAILTPPRDLSTALQRPTAVHRLDARVSGLVVVAKTRRAAADLSAAFQERTARKRYRALVLGNFDVHSFTSGMYTPMGPDGVSGTLEIHLEDSSTGHSNAPELHIHSKLDGKPAHTVLQVVERTPHVQAGWLTTLDLIPKTGRRHQLRRHCRALGFPICGDDLYAPLAGEYAGKRSAGLFLQSVEVHVPHPTREGEWANATLPEAPKFRRQRERALHGWQYQERARQLE